jgi:hypothetical protein
MKQLLVRMLHNYPPFKHLAKRADDIIHAWQAYKASVPVYGGIMLNAACDKMVLVKSYVCNPNQAYHPNRLTLTLRCATRRS